MDKKLRVWWMPQVDTGKTFYVPVQSVEEGKKVMDFLAAYDAFNFKIILNLIIVILVV